MKALTVLPNLAKKIFQTTPGDVGVSLDECFSQVSVQDLHAHLLSSYTDSATERLKVHVSVPVKKTVSLAPLTKKSESLKS